MGLATSLAHWLATLNAPDFVFFLAARQSANKFSLCSRSAASVPSRSPRGYLKRRPIGRAITPLSPQPPSIKKPNLLLNSGEACLQVFGGQEAVGGLLTKRLWTTKNARFKTSHRLNLGGRWDWLLRSPIGSLRLTPIPPARRGGTSKEDKQELLT